MTSELFDDRDIDFFPSHFCFLVKPFVADKNSHFPDYSQE
jgi:hypothetical protein